VGYLFLASAQRPGQSICLLLHAKAIAATLKRNHSSGTQGRIGSPKGTHGVRAFRTHFHVRILELGAHSNVRIQKPIPPCDSELDSNVELDSKVELAWCRFGVAFRHSWSQSWSTASVDPQSQKHTRSSRV
jgi:hypothetical protein